MIEPKSSDLVHDTLLTTQEPHLVGQEMHAGAYSNDTNKNMEDSPVFTGDSVPNSPISQVELEVPSQANRDDVVTHPISIETASHSTAIPQLDSQNQTSNPPSPSDIITNVIREISSQKFDGMEVDHPTSMETSIPIIGIQNLSYQPGTSSIPNVTFEDSSKKLDDETLASSNLATINQWLKTVHHDRPSGSQSAPPQLSKEALYEMSVDQVDEFSKIAQHLLNYQPSKYKLYNYSSLP